MFRQPDEAGDPLDGLDDRVAALTREAVMILESLPKPTSDIEVQRRVRAADFTARCISTIRKLRTDARRLKRPQDEDDMNDAHIPDDAETIERKYVELEEKLARFARRHDRRPDQGDCSAERTELGAVPLETEREPRAA